MLSSCNECRNEGERKIGNSVWRISLKRFDIKPHSTLKKDSVWRIFWRSSGTRGRARGWVCMCGRNKNKRANFSQRTLHPTSRFLFHPPLVIQPSSSYSAFPSTRERNEDGRRNFSMPHPHSFSHGSKRFTVMWQQHKTQQFTYGGASCTLRWNFSLLAERCNIFNQFLRLLFFAIFHEFGSICCRKLLHRKTVTDVSITGFTISLNVESVLAVFYSKTSSDVLINYNLWSSIRRMRCKNTKFSIILRQRRSLVARKDYWAVLENEINPFIIHYSGRCAI